MKIVVVGPGAMGCLLASSLARMTGEEVWLLDRHEDRAKLLRDRGIMLEGLSGPLQTPLRTHHRAGDIGVADLIIICAKSYSTDDVAKGIRELVGEKSAILTLQNGIGNVQILSDSYGEGRVLGGITNHGATLLGPGHVRHAGKGDTIIGRLDGKVTGFLRTVQGVFNAAGFETKVSRDIESVIWSKLIINVGINALTAVTGLNNGRLIEYDGTRELLRGAVAEALGIAKRKRIKLVYDDPVQKVESVCRGTAANVSSMLQDVLRKKRTEIDYINGAIVRQGKNLRVPTPVNEVLTHLVKTIEASYSQQLS